MTRQFFKKYYEGFIKMFYGIVKRNANNTWLYFSSCGNTY